jgi:hypothetical protein
MSPPRKFVHESIRVIRTQGTEPGLQLRPSPATPDCRFVIKAYICLSAKQAAGYAKKLGMASIAVALFVPVEDESVLKALSGETEIDGVSVVVRAIGWT